MKIWRCPECGRGQVKPVAVPGRTMRFLNIPNVEIPAGLAIPTCDDCGEEFMNGLLAEELDRALEVEYSARVARLATESIDVLGQDLRQDELERHLGLSQGYISKIKSGKKVPSADLALHLASLALDPGRIPEERRVLEYGLVNCLEWRCDLQKEAWGEFIETVDQFMKASVAEAMSADIQSVVFAEVLASSEAHPNRYLALAA